MEEQFLRTAMLLGEKGVQRLQNARVAVFGLGGVGGYVVEALCRAGIGALDLIDKDDVSLSNLNRQILATHATVGMLKTQAAARRLAEINPDCLVREYPVFYLPETADDFDFTQYDYIVDAVDTVTAKLLLVQRAKEASTPIISCMGTGNKLRPDLLMACDISKTTTCPLARVMRRELRARGIEHLRVVYSTEPPRTPKNRTAAPAPGQPRPKDTPGSSPWVPSSGGLLIASEVIARLLGEAEW